MDGQLLDRVTGDAIARDWELPELPSGTPPIPSTPSLPTSQELAEIFGNSDDEDDDFPLSLTSDVLRTNPFVETEGNALTESKEQPANSTSLFSSLLGTESTEVQLSNPIAPTELHSNVGGASEHKSDTAPVRKSSRFNLRQPHSKKEDTKETKPPIKVVKSEPVEDDKILPGKSARVVPKLTTVKEKLPVVKPKKEEEEGEGRDEEEMETEGEKESSDEDEEDGSISDDPDRLWCVCKKPHNDRFMICCDSCEEWFHGECVGISVTEGKRMERAGKEYICPVCTERGKIEKEVRSANRMARQEKREELRETRHTSITDTKDTHRKRSLSSSLSSGPTSDNYGIDVLFQPDNAPQRQSAAHSNEQGSDNLNMDVEAEDRRKRAFYRAQLREALSQTATCLVSQCSAEATPPSLYCSDACIEKYAAESLKILESHGVTFESTPSEFIRGSKGVPMVDKSSGKMVVGIQAPTDKTLVSWLKAHPSYEVLLPGGKHGRGFLSRPKKVKTEQRDTVKEEKREKASPGKQRSLNDPETVRSNAKKALLQTLWRRKEAVDDVVVTQEQVEKIANQIEVKLYDLHGDINTKYKTKYRSLLFNLKDTKNQGLFRKVCLGQISPTELVRMTSEQYASDELAEWREKTLKKDLDKIVEREEEARTSKQVIRKITCKGEVEIEAEKTETIETIAPPPEEVAVTPSTPTATTKFFIQSSDGAKQLEDGTKPKEALNSVKPAKSMSASKQDVQKKSGGSSGRTEPSTRPEVKGTSTETKKKEVGMEKQAMGLLDLLTDTTSEHEKHVYHPQCQICLGKEPPPSQSDNTESESDHNSPKVEKMQTESLPVIPLLWEGLIDMPGTIAFTSSAYPVSGDTDYVTTVLPSTLHVMGRIANVQVRDYIDKLQASTTREIVILRFDWTDEDRDGYESMLNYLVRKRRCGVVEEQLHGIKDFYLVPLMVDQPVPSHLLPFSGPGLPEDHPNLLLGVVVQKRGIKPLLSSNLAPDLSATNSLKRHLSTSSDDYASDLTTAAKRKHRPQAIGFGGQTPPMVDDDKNEMSHTEAMEVGDTNQDSQEMSFYGRHHSVSDSQDSVKTSKSSTTNTVTVTKQPPSGIKSILSQLSDEKLKELASAMSNIEESTSTPLSSAVTPSTVTSPATGQMVTASLSVTTTHTGAPHSTVKTKSDIPPGSADFNSRSHLPPNASQLQRPPLHPRHSDGRRNVASPNTNQPNYPSPQANNQGPPQSTYPTWDSPNRHHQQQPPQHYQSQHFGQPPSGGPPPNQYAGPPPHHPGSPHQYPSSPPQHIDIPPQQKYAPSNQYPPPHSQGPPNQHPNGQYPNPPHQYSGSGPQDNSVGHSQHAPPYQPNYDHHYQHDRDRNYEGSGQNWSSQEAMPRHPQSYPPRHGHYYEGESRIDELESRDYGHRSQPNAPEHTWRDREGGRGREHSNGRHEWRGRHGYRGRDRR